MKTWPECCSFFQPEADTEAKRKRGWVTLLWLLSHRLYERGTPSSGPVPQRHVCHRTVSVSATYAMSAAPMTAATQVSLQSENIRLGAVLGAGAKRRDNVDKVEVSVLTPDELVVSICHELPREHVLVEIVAVTGASREGDGLEYTVIRRDALHPGQLHARQCVRSDG
eukprot:PhM_4_TR14652/c2_g4_i3/m.91074